MSISAVGAGAFADRYAVTVAKTAIDAQKVEGENALQLIEAAKSTQAIAPPPKPGHSLSVIA